MNKTVLALSLGCALVLAGAGLRADTKAGLDTVTLKDGRVLHGEVIEESSDKVVLLDGGVKRSFGRSFIKTIAYGGGQADASAGPADGPESAGAPPAGAEVPEAPKGADLIQDISLRYRVPESDVVWVRQQGIADADLPLVFLVAATAQVTPRSVVKLRLSGLSWADIEAHYGMDSEHIYYEAGPWVPYPYYYYPGWGYWGAWGWGGGWGRGWGGGWGGGHWGGRWR